MRKQAFAALALIAAIALSLVGCGGSSGDDKFQQPEGGSTAPLGWLSPTPTPTPATTYPRLAERDFALVGYVPAKKAGEWTPDDGSRGLPVLIAGTDRVTAFRMKGVTCQVTLDDRQATPPLVLVMAATAKKDLRPGVFDYMVGAVGGGTVRAGGYVCK